MVVLCILTNLTNNAAKEYLAIEHSQDPVQNYGIYCHPILEWRKTLKFKVLLKPFFFKKSKNFHGKD